MSKFLFGCIVGFIVALLLALLFLSMKPVKTALWNSGHYPEFLIKKWPDRVDAINLCNGQPSVTSYTEGGVFLRCDDGSVYRK